LAAGDAMKFFVAAVDEGSLAGAGRRLRRPPAAVSRAIAFLEAMSAPTPSCSWKAAFITGEILHVDGGQSAGH